MIYTLNDAPKKIQYLVIESQFITKGVSNNFVIDFGLESNTFIEDMSEVVGVNMVDFYATQIGSSDTGNVNAAKFIDIICPELPLKAQMLSERKGTIFARIPIERNFGNGQDLVIHDKQWKGKYRNVNFFNPLSIKQLSFKLFESQGDGDYEPLRPDCSFFMVLEIYTLDRKAPPPEPDRRLEKAIKKLAEKIDELKPPPPESQTKTKKIPLMYIVIGLILLGGGVFMLNRLWRPSAPSVPVGPGVPGVPRPL